MKTKKLFFALLLLFLVINTYGQGIGISASYNMAKQKIILDGEVQPSVDIVHFKNLSSFGFGINYDVELTDNLYGELGFSYVKKGIKVFIEDGTYYDGSYHDVNEKMEINYIQLPFYLKYNFEVGDNMYAFGFGGLDLGLALGGKYIWESGSEKMDDKLKFGSSASDDYKSGDMGFTLGAGLLISNFELRVGLNNSIIDIDPDKDDATYNRVFFFGVGYRFDLN